MNDKARDQFSNRLRRAATVVVTCGLMAAVATHANPSNNIVVVPPTDLPELAQHTGEAMLLHEMIDGRTILYVEQEQGARLAIFDVTDPAHIKGNGSVQLSAAGPFDFVSPLGSKQELIQFRQGNEDAVLDLHNAEKPNLQAVQGVTLRGPITLLGNDGFIVAREDTKAPPARDYQVVDTAVAQKLNSVFDVKQVREEVSRADTGTTFLLAENGLYIVRQPAAEWNNWHREQERLSQYGGN
jgi:hypothetical protein